MAISRNNIYDSAAAPTGTNVLDQYASFVAALMDTAVMRLTSVAGTDTITATAEPISLPTAGYTAGMKFTFVPANNNTGAATLNIDSKGAASIVSANGGALSADDLDNSTRYLIEYDGTNFVVLLSQGATSLGHTMTTYDTTAVWTNNLKATDLVRVQLWAGGAGGYTNNGGGGGGGGYNEGYWLAGDLPATVTITIPSGGAVHSDGGDASFGSILAAYGGATPSSAGPGGGGGGETSAGSNTVGGQIGGGTGDSTTADNRARSIFGGGAGGWTTSNNGGDAVYGGGGGGAHSVGAGGTSVHGGNGGGDSVAGTLPAGGGGDGAAGGGGRCIITVIRS